MKLKEFADYLEEFGSMGSSELDGQYSHGKPEFGTIDNLRDMEIALAQRMECGNCAKCYWSQHCGETIRELSRVITICSEDEMKVAMKAEEVEQVTCGECVYCSQTNPRICMNPDSFAKHSYVGADDYCNKGERYA